jgi:hypothetical protein
MQDIILNRMKHKVFNNIMMKMKDLMALPFSPLEKDMPPSETKCKQDD